MQRTLKKISVLLIAGSTVACSSSPEVVFKRQNQASATLARMAMETDPQQRVKLERIYAAEEKLKDACAPVRHAASRRMSGSSTTPEADLKALASLDSCEKETQRIEIFIRSEAPASARLNLKQ